MSLNLSNFIIANDEDANELMKQISNLNELVENTERELKEKQAIVKKIKKEQEKAEQLIIDYYLEQKLDNEEYELDEDYGKVTSTKRDKWNYIDEKSLINQMERINPKLVRIKKELDKNAFKKAFEVVGDQVYDEDNDEYIDGVSVKRNTTYSLKVNCKELV